MKHEVSVTRNGIVVEGPFTYKDGVAATQAYIHIRQYWEKNGAIVNLKGVDDETHATD